MTLNLSRPKAPSRQSDQGSAGPLVYSPLAWLKLQFLCHAGPTEVAGFGLSHPDDPLYLEDILVVRQRCTTVTVAFDDAAVADLFDAMADAGMAPSRFARVWVHTHPGVSVTPSSTDEATFARAFGGCDWAVMAILGRTGRTSARLRFNIGPGGTIEIATAVDWSAWPEMVSGAPPSLAERMAEWQHEYDALVAIEPLVAVPDLGKAPAPSSIDPFDTFHFFEESFHEFD
jgi:proteasome lid subunit RPN8/RPN11